MELVSAVAQPLFKKAALARRANRFNEAEHAYRTWMRLEPRNPAPRYGLGCLLLSRGNFSQGWPLYEARTEIPQTGVRKPPLRVPEWRGQTVKSLLVWPEQGFGDQIMFARYVPEVLAMGVAVTLVTPPALARLFSAFGCPVIPAVGEMSLPRCDAWCLIGSLPRHFGTLPASPYLPGTSDGEGVGVMAVGNPAHVNDADRSLTAKDGAALLAQGRDLSPETTGAADFQDTAQIIRELAKVVSVDTAVAHLAGAMGKPVDILLGRDPDWRWGRSSERSLWYPSARLIRRAQD